MHAGLPPLFLNSNFIHIDGVGLELMSKGQLAMQLCLGKINKSFCVLGLSLHSTIAIVLF